MEPKNIYWILRQNWNDIAGVTIKLYFKKQTKIVITKRDKTDYKEKVYIYKNATININKNGLKPFFELIPFRCTSVDTLNLQRFLVGKMKKKNVFICDESHFEKRLN